MMMNSKFEYGTCQIKDIQVDVDSAGPRDKHPRRVSLQGRPLTATKRFWQSLHRRFGFTENFFNWFSPVEVFERISSVASNDQIRWCIEQQESGCEKILGVSNPNAPIVTHKEINGLLEQYGSE